MVKQLRCCCEGEMWDHLVLGWCFKRNAWKLSGFIKEHYIFPSEQAKIGKNTMMKTISNALWRFRHALNKYYVQRGLSQLNRFGYITPNEWDTFVQQHTTPQVVALSNKMKELNTKNKFRHKLGPRGYKAAMPK
jgi:hypothetical protein